MVKKHLKLLFATIIGSIAYRLGGAAKTGRWYDLLCGTKTRDAGVATVVMGVMWYLCPHPASMLWTILSILASGGLTFAAATSYFKKKGTSARWWNWCLVGLAFGVAVLPYSISVGAYSAFTLRTIFLIGAITLWSSRVSNAVAEELGRGALVVGSLILFL